MFGKKDDVSMVQTVDVNELIEKVDVLTIERDRLLSKIDRLSDVFARRVKDFIVDEEHAANNYSWFDNDRLDSKLCSEVGATMYEIQHIFGFELGFDIKEEQEKLNNAHNKYMHMREQEESEKKNEDNAD